jgi:hypothetical protein
MPCILRHKTDNSVNLLQKVMNLLQKVMNLLQKVMNLLQKGVYTEGSSFTKKN